MQRSTPRTRMFMLNKTFYPLLTLLAFWLGTLFASPVQAQCVNTSYPSCDVYTSCFARLCPCRGSPYEYFESYGKKYCEAFLANTQLTSKGKKWRDATLKCLQEETVRALPPDNQLDSCNCQQMQSIAFDTHVACYTQASASICDLPLSDWIEITSAADAVRNLADSKGRKQMLEVAQICISMMSGEAKKQVESIIEKYGQ